MFGLIGRITAQPGTREQLVSILLEGTGAMPGCLSYVVATDAADVDRIWVTEVWTVEAQHRASLELPAVKAAIARGRPLIAGFETLARTTPAGGTGVRA